MNDYVVTLKDRKINITLSDNSLVKVDGDDYHHELYPLSGDTYLLKLENKIYELSLNRNEQGGYFVSVDGKSYDADIKTALQERASALIEQGNKTGHIAVVKAPMPGLILKIKKSIGDTVQLGESILILEAMKMENDLLAPMEGTLKEINAKEGTTVEKGYILFTIE